MECFFLNELTAYESDFLMACVWSFYINIAVDIDETLNEVSNLSQYHQHDMIPTYVERQFFVIANLSGKLRNGQKGTATLPSRILIIGMKACNYEFPPQHTLHKKPPSCYT